MPFLDTTMIGCDDKDSLIQHTCILNRLNDLADIAVELFQLFIVGRCVMTFSMTDMIGFVENDIDQCRTCTLDIFNRTFGSGRILRLFRNIFIITQS